MSKVSDIQLRRSEARDASNKAWVEYDKARGEYYKASQKYLEVSELYDEIIGLYGDAVTEHEKTLIQQREDL